MQSELDWTPTISFTAAGSVIDFAVAAGDDVEQSLVYIMSTGTGIIIEKKPIVLVTCTEKVGELAWSQRAFTGLDWHVQLATPSVIEVAGAGLDVYTEEPKISKKLLTLPNVVLLPHIGSATIEGRLQMGDKVIINVQTFWDGHTPPDRVIEAML